MIPSRDVDVCAEIPEDATFWVPSPSYLEEEAGRWYSDEMEVLIDVTHQEAEFIAHEEAEAAELVDYFAHNVYEFEAIADAIQGRDADKLPPQIFKRVGSSALVEFVGTWEDEPKFGNLELGVAGLSYALASVGCYPAASCRWRCRRHGTWTVLPVVYLAAERQRVERLQPLVQAAGCGFDVDVQRPDLLMIDAPSIRHTMDLTHRILGASPDSRSRQYEHPKLF